MKKLVLLSCLLITIAVKAQKEKGEAYINTYKEIAMQEMLRTGVPAAITLAQGILESQFGESDLVKTSNNHFGIKCKTEWTGAKTYHDDDEKAECFRVYPTAMDSYKDHSDFLKTRPNYAFLFKLDPTDFEGWAKGLKKAGYATSPVYPQKLLKVINDYNLQQYSLQALARAKNTVPADTMNTESSIKTESERLVNGGEVNTMADRKAVTYPAGIFSINHTKVIYAKEGTSLLSLANQYDIPLSKLIEYNDLEAMDVLDMDRLMFIEKKSKKGAGDFHRVAMGETLHDIAQLEGIRLESLLEYNHLSKGSQVATGDRIFLRAVTLLPIAKSPK